MTIFRVVLERNASGIRVSQRAALFVNGREADEGTRASKRISLAEHGGKLYMTCVRAAGRDPSGGPGAWDFDSAGEPEIFWRSYDGASFSEPRVIRHAGSRYGASLCAYEGSLFAVWRGPGQDTRLYFAELDERRGEWGAVRRIPGAKAAYGASLAVFRGAMIAAWSNEEGAIFTAKWRDDRWSAPARTGETCAYIPSVAVFSGDLHMASRGAGKGLFTEGDERLYFGRTRDGVTWGGSASRLPGAESEYGPGLVVFDGKLWAFWRGSRRASAAFWSALLDAFRLTLWEAAGVGRPGGVVAIEAEAAPRPVDEIVELSPPFSGEEALAACKDERPLDPHRDTAVYYSSLDSGEESGWSPPQILPGVRSLGPVQPAVFRDRLYLAAPSACAVKSLRAHKGQ